MLAIKGDGHCCYHIASAIGSLFSNQHSFLTGWVPCTSEDLKTTRAQILGNFHSWVEKKEVWCSSVEELEAEYVLPHLGVSSEVFRKRVSGEAVGKDKWGTVSDLALYTLLPLEDDIKACTPAYFDRSEEVPKSRVVYGLRKYEHLPTWP